MTNNSPVLLFPSYNDHNIDIVRASTHTTFLLMPSPNPHHESSAAAAGGGAPSFKRSPMLFSLLLKATIMALVTCLFFVFLGVAAIILLNVCLAGGLLHRRGSLSPEDDDDGLLRNYPRLPRPGISPSDLRRVPKFRFFSHGKIAAALGKQREATSADCAICLDEVKEGQWCRRLVGCGHVFHKGCVDSWLVRVAACPLCRRRVRGLREGGGRGRDSKVDGFQGLLWL
ncbi:hypothetical protein MLD38_014919 [Melastoma candidum]|uniref:Uncharacterized protein n=1 Tax=Melastoma candidum TaxID=119954 RepID=A0ACB9REF5_9MYRT|nr:hypothetical protein MLD38_014919 [Melastoma candidum]